MLPGVGEAARVRNRRGEGERLRAEILRAASEELAEAGDVDLVSIRSVARRAGISAPAVYLHFADKREMLGAAIAQSFLDLRDTTRSAFGADDDPVACLRAGCRAYLEFAATNPGHYRVLFTTPTGAGGETARSAGLESFAVLVGVIQRCMDAGAAPEGDARAVATSVWVAMHGMATLRSTRPDFDWPGRDEQLDEFLVRLVGIALPA
jgi:AcrR family transcriptional regulator